MIRGASLSGALVALWLSGAAALDAQVSGTLDLGLSDIRYDLFRSSTALSLTPAIAFDRGWTSVALRGTMLRYQSGHRDLHGALVASTFTPPVGPFRLELGGDGGASRYLTLATFSHVFGSADLHFLRVDHGAWLGGTAGATSFGGVHRAAHTAEMGAWYSASFAALTLTASYSSIGDTSYEDIAGAARVNRGRWELDGRLGARGFSTGGGHGVYGEAAVTFTVAPHAGVVFGAGRYPTDPTRGTIAGRYLTLGVHFGIRSPRPTDPYREVLDRYQPAPSADPPAPVAEVEVGPRTPAGQVLRVRVDHGGRVEVMGDFTDWRPVELRATAAAGVWEVTVPAGPGPHLLEVRIDGGAWLVPAGATPVRDEFGSAAGLIVVP